MMFKCIGILSFLKMKIKNKLSLDLKTILFSLILVFVFFPTYFFLPISPSFKRILFPLLAILGLIFSILGIILICYARKEKGKMKTFLLLTGFSAAASLIFALLHNLFYGIAISFNGLSSVFAVLHAVSFLISILITPILFIIGVTGSIILLRKKNRIPVDN